MKRVVVVDDHTILLNLVSDYLKYNSEFEVVGTFKSGNDLLFAYKRGEAIFDFLLLDLFMEDGDMSWYCILDTENPGKWYEDYNIEHFYIIYLLIE